MFELYAKLSFNINIVECKYLILKFVFVVIIFSFNINIVECKY